MQIGGKIMKGAFVENFHGFICGNGFKMWNLVNY